MRYVNLRRVALLPALLVCLILTQPSRSAASGLPVVSLSASTTSATTSSQITFTVSETGTFPPFTMNGQTVYPCDPYGPQSTGSGNTFYVNGSPLSSTNNYATATFSGDSSGNGTCSSSFVMQSSVAESKTVSLYGSGIGCPCSLDTPTLTVTFTTPAPQPVASTPKVTSKVASTPTSTTPQPPAAPTAASVKVDGTVTDTSKPVAIESDKPLVLSGKTVPNGIVTLTIHSTPRTVTTTADKDGNWSYTVTGLAAGSHYVEANVKDPATGQTSPTAKLLSFTVTAAKLPKTSEAALTPPKKSLTGMYVLLLLILALLGAGWYGWKWWNDRKAQNPAPPAGPAA